MPREKIKILAVDDCEDNLLALTGCLSRQYAVTTARCGKDALQLVQEERFALILLDVRMTEMNGFQTAACLRQFEAAADTPIIFLTAYGTDTELVQKGYQVGCVDFIQKPVSLQVLMSKMAVFTEVHRKQLQMREQAQNLAAASMKLVERTQTLAQSFMELEEARRLLCPTPRTGLGAEETPGGGAVTGYVIADLVHEILPSAREIAEVIELLLTSTPTTEQATLLQIAREAAGSQLKILARGEGESLP